MSKATEKHNYKAFIEDYFDKLVINAKPVFYKVCEFVQKLPDTLKSILGWILSMVKVITHFLTKITHYVTPSFSLKELTVFLLVLGFASKVFLLIKNVAPLDNFVVDYLTIFTSQYLLVITGILNSFQTFYVDFRDFATNYNMILHENRTLKETLETVRETYHSDLKEMTKKLTEVQGETDALRNVNANLSAENSQFLRELKELKSTTEWDKYIKILTILSSSLTVGSNVLSLSFSLFDLFNGNSQAQDIKDIKQHFSSIRTLILGLYRRNNQDLASDRLSGDPQNSVLSGEDLNQFGEIE